MANTFFGLTIGHSGLYAANVALDVTGHNIANEHTTGYSRQNSIQSATRAMMTNMKYGMIGTGVKVDAIEQFRDLYYDTKYRNNQSRLGEYEVKNYHMRQIEDNLNEMDSEGFTTEYGNFFDALLCLKDSAAGFAERNAVTSYAKSLLDFFEVAKANLVNQQEDVNEEIKDKVDRINTIAADIAVLNKQINIVELTGAAANDLRDRRALLVDEISQYVEVSVDEQKFDNNKTEYRVKIGGNVIVDNYTAYSLEVVTREKRKEDTDAVGLYDIQWSYGPKFDPSASGYQGELKGLLEIRDGNNKLGDEPVDYKGIPYYIKEINDFLETFTTAFNEIHSTGYNIYGDKISDLDDSDFFIVEGGVYKVNDKYHKDPMLIAASTDPISQGIESTGIIDEFLKLREADMYEGGRAIDFLQKLTTEMGVDTRKTETMLNNYEAMKVSVSNQRLAVSGVDKDEEAANMMKYEEAYKLAAKVISVMTEIYDVLIREMGV